MVKSMRKKDTFTAVILCILMISVLTAAFSIRSTAFAASENDVEIVGTPTVYIQSGGETIIKIQVKNTTTTAIRGVNMVTYGYFGELGGPVEEGTSSFASTNPNGGASDNYYRFLPWFEKKDYEAVNAVWDSDEEGYTISAGATASLWFKVQSHYEKPGTYNEWIRFTDMHTELQYSMVPRPVIDRNLSGECPVKVVVYNPANAALTVGTSTNDAFAITPVALGSPIDFGTVNLAGNTDLTGEKTIYTRNTSNYNNYSATDEHGLSSDIEVDFFVEKEDGERLYNADLTPFGWNSHLLSGMHWAPLPAASMDASEFQSAETGITLDATEYVAGTYNAYLVLNTTPHGVKVNGAGIQTNGIYKWPAKVVLTGTNPRIPKAPTSLKATAGNGQVELTWSAPSGVETGSFYRIYRRMGTESSANKANLSNAAFNWEDYEEVGSAYVKEDGSCLFVDGTVTNGKTYTYVVSGGEPRKAYPAITNAVTPKESLDSKIQAVSSFYAGSEENGVLLEWEMNDNYGGSDNDGSSMVDHFNIYRDGRLVAQINQNAVIDDSNTTKEWSEEGVWITTTTHSYSWKTIQKTPVVEQSYTWNVVPVSKSGIEGYRSQDVSCSGYGRTMKVASHIANYDADLGVLIEVIVNDGYWNLAGAKYWRKEGTGAPDTSGQPTVTEEVDSTNGYTRALFVDTSYKKGSTYTYTARLFDEDGVETPDYTFTVKTAGPSGSASASYSSTQVDWKVIDGKKAEMKWYCDYYYDDNGDYIYYGTYKVQRKKGSGSWTTIKTISTAPDSGSCTITDDPGSDGTYTYRMDKTVNGITVTGKEFTFSRKTTAVDESTLLKAPDTPVFRVRMSDRKPVLYWAPSETGGTPAGYRIYRRDAGRLVNGERYYQVAPWLNPYLKQWENECYIIIDDPAAGTLVDEDGNYQDDASKGKLERPDWNDSECPHEYWIVAYNDAGISEPSEIVTLTNQGYDENDLPIPPVNEDAFAPAKPVIDDVWVDWNNGSTDSSAWNSAAGGYIHVSWTDPESSRLSIDSWRMDVTGLEDENYKTLYSWEAIKEPAAKLGTGDNAPKVYVSSGYGEMDDYDRTVNVTVTAINEAGASTSEPRSITIRSFPRFRTVNGNSEVKLEWTDLLEDTQTQVTGWEVWRKGETGSWKKIQEFGVLTPNESGIEYYNKPISYYSWVDTDVENGWNYDYRIVAVCADGIDRPSPTVSAYPTLTAATEAPGAPENLTYKVVNGEVLFTFDPPATGTAQCYQLMYEADYGGTKYWVGAGSANAPSTSILWSQVNPGTYQAFVYAYSYINGEEAPERADIWDDEASFDEKYPSHSNVVTVTITEAQIEQQAQEYPGAFTLTATPGESQVKLSWTASSGATSYTVKRYEGDDFAEVTLPASTRTFTDSTAMPGIRYTYHVYANNICGSTYNLVKATPTGKSKDEIIAEAVAAEIAALPSEDDITLENVDEMEAAVKAAKEDYDKLTDEQRSRLPADTAEKLSALLDKLEFIRLNQQYAEAVAPVQETINLLPVADEITVTNLEEIKESAAAARADYAAITPEDAKKLVNIEKLVEAEAKIKSLEQYLADMEIVNALKEEILALPAADTFTKENLSGRTEAIEKARAAYQQLSESQKALMDKEGYAELEKLEAVETRVEEIKALILTEVEQAKNLIYALDVTAPIEDEDKIIAAREAYDSLTDEQKAMVGESVLNRLTGCEEILAYRKSEEPGDVEPEVFAVKTMIDHLPATEEITPQDAETVSSIRAAYEALSDEQKANVPAELLEKLSAAEEKLSEFSVRDIKDAVITVAEATYTGKALTPEVTVKYKGVALKEGTDYSASYQNNTEVGTATVTVTGMGAYTGEVTKNFTIVAAKPKWVKQSGKWYYILGNGKYAKGWLKISGKWYFFKSDGSMAAKEWCKGYWLNKDGTCTYKYKASWKKDGKGWWYGDASGWYAKNSWQLIDGKWYFFKANGYMASNEWAKGYWLNKDGTCTYKYKASWKKDGKGWYYGDTSGWYAKNGWQQIDGKWYYFDAKGYIVTGTRTIGGKTYTFDAEGVCLNP